MTIQGQQRKGFLRSSHRTVQSGWGKMDTKGEAQAASSLIHFFFKTKSPEKIKRYIGSHQNFKNFCSVEDPARE